MSKKFSPEEIKQGTLSLIKEELLRTKILFKRELLKSCIQRIEAGQDPHKVVSWSYKIEKLFNKLEL